MQRTLLLGLFICLFAAGIWMLSGRPAELLAPEIGIEGHSFDATAADYADRAKSVFQLANEKRKSLNAWGRWYHTAAVAAAWIAFFCTTAITAVAAFFNPGIDPEQAKSADALKALQKRLKKRSWVIGVLAAVAAGCAALTDRAGAEANREFGCANEMMQSVQETRIRLVDQNPPPAKAQAEGLLDALENKVNQACSGASK
jgi:hypothetical protein